MHFTKLRLAGFKSFVEPAEFGIEPGLTGIVGPNGCGKSNLVEALQWAMGETSARRLRGGDMDDVIFGGTSSRPARDIASVTIWLDNADRRAPALLNDSDELQIERRIDRGRGSTYRVNGREMRARDVQLLFADAASGAGSSALVGQGRIGWLINAKPTERRALLEEAAGIGGLQARRHEAELRLAAAEQNLTRLDDVAKTLAVQIERLQRQARQAARYRVLSQQIRVAEALALDRLHRDRLKRHGDTAQRLGQSQARVEAGETVAAQAETARDQAIEAVPPLRLVAAEAMRIAERLGLEQEGMRAEARRVAEQLRDLAQRLDQIERDRLRERGLVAEAEAALARIAEETARLHAEQNQEGPAQEQAGRALATSRDALREIEAALSTATALAARRDAERVAVQRRLLGFEDRRQRLRRQQAEADARTRELDMLSVSKERMAAARAATLAAEAQIETARGMGEVAERSLREAEALERAAREPVQCAERECLTLKAEIDALTRLAQSGTTGGHAPVLDSIKVTPGLERALGAVLGDDLLASLNGRAAIHWAEMPALELAGPALPEGARPFAREVTVPPQLKRRLDQIGLVEDAGAGQALRERLQPGQRLVTRDGMVWRWDGLTQAAGAPTAAATRLAQRNRLEELREAFKAASSVLAEAQTAHKSRADEIAAARQAEQAAREALRLGQQRLGQQRHAESQLIQQAQAAETRRHAAEDSLKRLATDTAELDEQVAEALAEQAKLPDPAAARAETEALRLKVEAERETERGCQRELDRLMRDATARRIRLDSLHAESRAWHDRAGSAVAQRQRLDERHADLSAERDRLSGRPDEITAELARLEAAIQSAKAEAVAAANALAESERAARDAETKLTAAARDLAEAREARIRAEAAQDQAADALEDARRRIAEAFDCTPEGLADAAGLDAATLASMRPVAELDAEVERLKRDRDAIGPVNLMAESEMAEIQAQLTTLETESADLRAAIVRLRQGIQQLNTEGRERLLAAFQVINGHFSTLFRQLFGGGRAYLELIQHESDPLMAGIEIMASPPGKKLQALSLLSGGERALTALALVFGMFLTNPAPICVLDEVDAPLDDANVERFCQLVRDIAARTGTRFLVVTHHRVSMARMDRLYGVTMIERGVSRLVSVDLVEAGRMRESA